MANEKIKCKKCKKSFDPDLYSGLCPKCGTYNGRHMDSSALEHYISGIEQGEKEHRKLHEKYDQGYETAHPDHNLDHNASAALLQEARESFAKRRQQQTLINGKPVKKGGISKYLLIFVITIIIAAAVVIISSVYWNIAYKQQADIHSVKVVPVQEPGTVVFVHELLDGPVTIEAKAAGILEEIEGLTGKSLYGVSVSGGSEEYNFDASLSDVFLQYEFEGNTYYDFPMDSYSLEEFCKRHNIWKDDVLSGYSLGNGEMQEGYLFFIVDTDGEDYQLLLQTTRSEEPSVVLQEAVIHLEALPALILDETEVE